MLIRFIKVILKSSGAIGVLKRYATALCFLDVF